MNINLENIVVGIVLILMVGFSIKIMCDSFKRDLEEMRKNKDKDK